MTVFKRLLMFFAFTGVVLGISFLAATAGKSARAVAESQQATQPAPSAPASTSTPKPKASPLSTQAPQPKGFECLLEAPSNQGVGTYSSGSQHLGTLKLQSPGPMAASGLSGSLGILQSENKLDSRYVTLSLDAAHTAQSGSDATTCFTATGTGKAYLRMAQPTITIQTPTSGANLKRLNLTLFTAGLKGIKSDQYALYWQVDNDQLNRMDTGNGTALKTTVDGIDLSLWNWKGSGPYLLKFIAKDLAGNTVAHSEITVWVVE